jgi:hypothetical protein
MKGCFKQIVRVVLSTAVVFHLRVLTALARESESEDKTEQRIREVGDVVQVALPVSALAGTLLAKDKDGSFQFLKSFGFGTASVWALKEIAQKLRPDASNPNSFPSGLWRLYVSTGIAGGILESVIAASPTNARATRSVLNLATTTSFSP